MVNMKDSKDSCHVQDVRDITSGDMDTQDAAKFREGTKNLTCEITEATSELESAAEALENGHYPVTPPAPQFPSQVTLSPPLARKAASPRR